MFNKTVFIYWFENLIEYKIEFKFSILYLVKNINISNLFTFSKH